MKQLAAILFLTILTANLFGQQSPKFKIKITGADCTYGVLLMYSGDKQIAVDTAKFSSQGAIVFKRKKPYVQGKYALIYTHNKESNYLTVLLSYDQRFSVETTAEYPVKNAVVKDSEENKLYYDFFQFLGLQKEKKKAYVDRAKLYATNDNKDSAAVYYRKLKDLNNDVVFYRDSIIKNYKLSYLAAKFKLKEVP